MAGLPLQFDRPTDIGAHDADPGQFRPRQQPVIPARYRAPAPSPGLPPNRRNREPAIARAAAGGTESRGAADLPSASRIATSGASFREPAAGPSQPTARRRAPPLTA